MQVLNYQEAEKPYFVLEVLVNFQAGFNTPDLTNQLKSTYTVVKNTSLWVMQSAQTYCKEVKTVHY